MNVRSWPAPVGVRISKLNRLVFAVNVVRRPFPGCRVVRSRPGSNSSGNGRRSPSASSVKTAAVRIRPPNLTAASVPGIRIEPGKVARGDDVRGAAPGPSPPTARCASSRSSSAACSFRSGICCWISWSRRVQRVELRLHARRAALFAPRSAASCASRFDCSASILACCSAISAALRLDQRPLLVDQLLSWAIVGFGAGFLLGAGFGGDGFRCGSAAWPRGHERDRKEQATARNMRRPRNVELIPGDRVPGLDRDRRSSSSLELLRASSGPRSFS